MLHNVTLVLVYLSQHLLEVLDRLTLDVCWPHRPVLVSSCNEYFEQVFALCVSEWDAVHTKHALDMSARSDGNANG